MNIGKDSAYSPNGKDVTYCPDFWIPSLNKFIEVKGRNNYEHWKEDDSKLKFEKFRDEFCQDWKCEIMFGEDLTNLGINLKAKEPKYIFKDKEEEEKYVKNRKL